MSVIIPLYNSEQHIGETLESVLTQTYRNYEIIIVDDGSTDGSAGVVQRFGSAVRYLYQPNAGVAVATNRGVALARGELIALLDNDDVWLPRKLERQVDYLDRHASCGYVTCDMQYMTEDGTPTDKILKGCRDPRPYAKYFQRGYSSMSSSIMVRRTVFERVGGFDERFVAAGLQDMEWMSRVADSTELGYVAEVLVLYRDHGPRIPSERAKLNERLYLSLLWERYGHESEKRRFLAGERAAYLSSLGEQETQTGALAAGRAHLLEAITLAASHGVAAKVIVRSLLRLLRSFATPLLLRRA